MARPQILKHMSPHDIPVFVTWLFSPEGQAYQGWEFDVIIGKPTDPGPFFPSSQRRQAMYLTALKIDALGWFFDSPTLIECKPDADCGAIGQILVYKKWFEIIFNISPRTMLVCERMSEQVQIYCTIVGIDVRIVPPASKPQVADAIAYVIPRLVKRAILPDYPI